MKVFIYVEIFKEIDFNSHESSFSYDKPLMNFVKKNFPEVITYDFDNFSEKMLIEQAIKLLEQADTICIFLNSKADTPLLGFMPFLQKILQKRKSCLVFLEGDHTQLSTFLKPLQPQETQATISKDLIQDALKDWIKNSTNGLYLVKS